MAESTLRSGDIADALDKGQTATCVSGPFEGMQATKTDEGYLMMVHIHFWDTRFAHCEWVLTVSTHDHNNSPVWVVQKEVNKQIYPGKEIVHNTEPPRCNLPP